MFRENLCTSLNAAMKFIAPTNLTKIFPYLFSTRDTYKVLQSVPFF